MENKSCENCAKNLCLNKFLGAWCGDDFAGWVSFKSSDPSGKISHSEVDPGPPPKLPHNIPKPVTSFEDKMHTPTENKQDWRDRFANVFCRADSFSFIILTEDGALKLDKFVSAEIASAVAAERERAKGVIGMSKKLINQIAINDFEDSIGHPAKMNKAYCDLSDALKTYEEGK